MRRGSSKKDPTLPFVGVLLVAALCKGEDRQQDQPGGQKRGNFSKDTAGTAAGGSNGGN